jgi:hypothetical protein
MIKNNQGPFPPFSSGEQIPGVNPTEDFAMAVELWSAQFYPPNVEETYHHESPGRGRRPKLTIR